MNYNLNELLKTENETVTKKSKKFSLSNIFVFTSSFKHLFALLAKSEKKNVFVAIVALLVNAVCSLLGPYIIGRTIDVYIAKGDISGLAYNSVILLIIFLVALAANFLQIRIMGGVGQRTLFTLRNNIFKKIQELPLAFFNQNKAGDLISRINNDTEKLSQFFSETLTRFLGSIVMIGGAAVFLLVIQIKLGIATLLPAVGLVIITSYVSGVVRRANERGLASTGALSGEIQESLQNFKVIVAFDRRDYFRKRFQEINEQNAQKNVRAGLWNGVFSPLYDFAANLGQFAVLAYGIYLIAAGAVTIGILVSFLAYAEKFYNPLRQMAQLWANAQVALAAWQRIGVILSLESNLKIIDAVESDDSDDSGDISESAKSGATAISTAISASNSTTPSVLSFKDVAFHYSDSKTPVLKNVNFDLLEGKTYALVGPTGGGKTTTASLMARLYDPTNGTVLLDGKDIRSYSKREKTKRIGFILQDPIIFMGTVGQNVAYGHDTFSKLTNEDLLKILNEQGLEHLLSSFDDGLNTEVPKNIDAMSLGQKQIIAFLRAVLRKPDLLILDEATANIDTVTEQILEDILKKLPATTTKVIIAHRLNTIKDADVIYFVNGGTVTMAGSMDDAIEMLLHVKRGS